MILPILFLLFLKSVAGTCPDGSVENSFGSRWKCLMFVPSSKASLEAEEYCNSNYNGHLVSINNGFSNIFIAQILNSTFMSQNLFQFWIGLSYTSGIGWTYTDGSNATFYDWAPGEPSSSGEINFCVYIDFVGTWHADSCLNYYPFICGVPEVGANSTQPTPSGGKTTTQPMGYPTTSAHGSSSSCYSYIPFAIDTSLDLTADQFSKLKNFILTSFVSELFPTDLQPASIVNFHGLYNIQSRVPGSVSELVHLLNNTRQLSSDYSYTDAALDSITDLGVFDYNDGIPINSVVFAGNTKQLPYYNLQDLVDFLTVNGSTVTIVFVNPDLNLTNFENLKNVSIITWTDDSTELLMKIRKNMKCGGGSPVYHPCKSWFSFVPDFSNSLSMTDFRTQQTFIKSEIAKMNRPDKIQIVDGPFPPLFDWTFSFSISYILEQFIDIQSPYVFNLTMVLQDLSDAFYSNDKTGIEPPYAAFVFVSNTSSYANYGGADALSQELRNIGLKLNFVLMGPDVDESKLANYTTNFIYWRNLNNPQPENWDTIRLDAYGCTS